MSRIVLAPLIALVTLAAYWPVTEAGFVWDDDDYILNNHAVLSPDGLGQIWFEIEATPQYYPLVFSTFWLEHRIWGLDPAGYHVVNVLLHALSAMLLAELLLASGVAGAWVAAALFALHPVHVESVAWIAERKNVLSGVFYLASALVFLRLRAKEIKDSRRPAWVLHTVPFGLFVLALLSKTTTVSLPAALLLVLWWKHGRIRSTDVAHVAPYFVVGIAFAMITLWMEANVVGSRDVDWNLTLVERGLIAGRATVFYLRTLLWPDCLTFVYPRWDVQGGSLWQYSFPALILAGLFATWMARARIGRGPFVALAFFVGTLTPALGFFNVYPMRYSWVADHFQYLASIGPITFAAAAGTIGVRRLGAAGARVALTVLACALVILGSLTWRQTHVYSDLESLWRDTLRKNPAAWLAHTNLGAVLQNRGDLRGAIEHYRASLQHNPGDELAQTNLAFATLRSGDVDGAIELYKEAIRFNVAFYPPYQILAWVLATRHHPAPGDRIEAVRLARKVVELTERRDANALQTLAAAYAANGRYREAERIAEAALGLGPRIVGPELAREILSRLELYREDRPVLIEWEAVGSQ